MERLVLSREGLSVVPANLAFLDTALASDYDLENVVISVAGGVYNVHSDKCTVHQYLINPVSR